MAYRPSWSRFAALLLLLLGLCDLTVPGFCKTDFADGQAISVGTPTPSASPISGQVQMTASNQKDLPPQGATLPDTDTDDCWCCCSHINTTTPDVALVTLDHVSNDMQILRVQDPMWRVSELFQPPKA